MKLVLPKAYVATITNKTAKLDKSDEIVKVHDIKLTADVDTGVLEELKEGLTARHFDKHGIPHDPEIGMRQWEPQYENGTMKMGDMTFSKVRLRNINYIAKPGGIVGIELTARVTQDDDKSGRLTQLVKEGRKVTFEKMTQAEIKIDDDAEVEDDSQGKLPGTEGPRTTPKITPLLPGDKSEETATH